MNLSPGDVPEPFASSPAGSPSGPAEGVLGIIAWGWVLFLGALYLDAYPLRLERWSEATITGGGAWHFPTPLLTAVLVAGTSIAVAWALGRAIGFRIRLWRGEPGEQAVAVLAGLALLSMGVFALGVAGLLRAPFLWGLLVAGALISRAILPGGHRRNAFIPEKPTHFPPRGFALLPALLAAAALLISFLAALAPAVESDGLRYHLFGPQEFLRTGSIHYIPHSAFTNFPFLVEMLFTLGLGLGNDTAAKLLHWVHLPLAAVLIASLASRMIGSPEGGERGQPRARVAPWLAATFFLCTPVAAIVAGWSFIDLAITAYFLGLVYFLGRCSTAGYRTADLLAAGFFAGAAIGTKYTMVLPAMLAGFVVVVSRVLEIRVGFRRLLVFAGAAAICSLPWFAKNGMLTGNPVYPLAYGVFDGGDWSTDAARFYRAKAAEKGTRRGGLGDFIAAPFDTAFYWSEFEAQNPGPGYLLVFPLGVAWLVARFRRRAPAGGGEADLCARRTLVLAAGFALFTALAFFAGYKSNRFLLPIWALAAALTGAFIGEPPDLGNRVRRVGVLLRPQAVAALGVFLASGYGVYWTARYLATDQQPPPIPVALGFADRDEYLSAALSYYPAVEWLGLHAREGEKVFYIAEYHGYPSRVPLAVSDWFDVPYLLDFIRSTPNNDVLLDRLGAEGFRYILVTFQELRGYGARYLRPRFTPPEWKRFEDLLQSPRLLRRFFEEGTAVFEIVDR